MPKINQMILKLEGFQYATSISLNTGYYHIQIRNNASNLCTIILYWGNILQTSMNSIYQLSRNIPTENY